MKKTILFLASCMMTIISFAQITTSSISGVVVNEKKEVMVGASVIATHMPTGTTYKTVTNKTGAFVFPAVRVGGPFTVATNYVGFKKLHPHDTDSLLRISLDEKHKGISTIKTMLIGVITEAIKKIQTIKGCFDGTRV